MKSLLALPVRVGALCAVSAAAALAGCGGVAADDSSATASPATSATTSSSSSASTKAGLKKAKWSKKMTVTYGARTIRFRSNGIPNHSRSKYYAVPNTGVIVPTASTAHTTLDPTGTQSEDYKIPTTPKKVSKTTSTSLGSIGMMISGAPLFNPYEGDNTTVAMANNFVLTTTDGFKAPFVDDCSGHPTPGGPGGNGGFYHYHGLPACVSKEVDTSSGPSHIIGVAFDGFPIYGKRDIKGKVIPASKLDKCNGITSATPEFPNGIYHYVLPGTSNATSSIRCFHGKVDSSLITQMPNMGGPPGGGPPGGGPPPATARTSSVAARLLCDLTGLSL